MMKAGEPTRFRAKPICQMYLYIQIPRVKI